MIFGVVLRKCRLTLCWFLTAIVVNAVVAVAVDAQSTNDTDSSAHIKFEAASNERADSLYLAAREAQVARDYPNAIRIFDLIARRYPRSPHATAALYYKAFVLYRQYKQGQPPVPLRLALNTLQLLEKKYPNAPQASLGQSLQTRICGELGQLGDSSCIKKIEKEATVSTVGIIVLGEPDKKKGSLNISFGVDSQEKTAEPLTFQLSGQLTIVSDSAVAVFDSATCAEVEKGGDTFITALNSMFKVDTAQALQIASMILVQKKQPCLTKLREKTLITVLQRPVPVLSMAPVLFMLAKTDSDANIKRLSLVWLRSQEWPSEDSKYLTANFGGVPFKVKTPEKHAVQIKARVADTSKGR